jgi:hypothetical protein
VNVSIAIRQYSGEGTITSPTAMIHPADSNTSLASAGAGTAKIRAR